jgi:hypothetical protein
MGQNLDTLTAACSKLLVDYNDFWVLAGVTDCSFEEGTRSHDFRAPCESYRNAGVSGALLDQLIAGVNGNLAAILANTCVCGSVRRNKWKGQDLGFQASKEAPEALAEVKLVFDCTLPRFYELVAADWHKLVAVRQSGYSGDLFLAVFFLQMPRHDYPAGRWYGKTELPRRARFVKFSGIDAQFAQVRKSLHVAPVWPDEPPFVQSLSPTLTMASADVFDRRYSHVLSTAERWQFDPAVHLQEAAVGVAVWQLPDGKD